MKLNVKKLFAMMLALTLVFSMAACGGNDGNADNNASSGSNTSNNASSGSNTTTGGTDSYTISVVYDAQTKSTIAEDMVNQVMFAYGGGDDGVTVETVLTLDPSAMTYVLTKAIITDEYENEEGEMQRAFKGEWEFTGSYTVSDSDENSIVLLVPTSGKNNIYYPTVLNYQSIEKQTQDWVDSSADPAILTRFNKWYPSKASTVVDQPVTLSGNTMTFGEVDLSAPEEEAPAPAENDPAEAAPADDGVAVDESAIIGAVADGKVINLYADGAYKFEYATYGIVEEGTWTWTEFVFSGETANGNTFTAEFNADYNLAFTYVTDASSAITADFVLENWGDALGADGTYTPAE